MQNYFVRFNLTLNGDATHFRADTRKNRVYISQHKPDKERKADRREHVYVDTSLFIRVSVNDRRRCSASLEDTDNTRPTRKDAFITRLPRDNSV